MMAVIRVPLVLETTNAVIHRLHTTAIKTSTPYVGADTGFDKMFREPRVFDGATQNDRKESTIYLPPVEIACQVEVARFEQIQQVFQGDVPDTVLTLVVSRIDLERADFLDTTTNRPIFKVNDKITDFKKNGRVVRHFIEPLFIHQVQPASYGFGPDGQDLELIFVADREKASR